MSFEGLRGGRSPSSSGARDRAGVVALIFGWRGTRGDDAGRLGNLGSGHSAGEGGKRWAVDDTCDYATQRVER